MVIVGRWFVRGVRVGAGLWVVRRWFARGVGKERGAGGFVDGTGRIKETLRREVRAQEEK